MNGDFSAGLRARVALEKHGFSFTRALGQNFILDDDFVAEIVELAGVGEGDCVLEIGPGAGIMTRLLAERCAHVLAVEIDRKLEPVLSGMLADVDNAEVVFEDVLKCDLPALLNRHFPGKDVRVVANLPYYITADAITQLLTCGARIDDVTLMVQKEAAERIDAALGEKNYGALAMTVKYYCDVETLMDVPPQRFTPPPHVMSRLIRLSRRADGVRARNEALLLRLIRSAFRMRRKTLVNNLTGDFPLTRAQAEALLAAQGFDARIRGEALTIDQMAALADALEEILSGNAR